MYITKSLENVAQAPACPIAGRIWLEWPIGCRFRTKRPCNAEPVANVVAEFNSTMKITASTISCKSQQSSVTDLESFRNA